MEDLGLCDSWAGPPQETETTLKLLLFGGLEITHTFVDFLNFPGPKF